MRTPSVWRRLLRPQLLEGPRNGGVSGGQRSGSFVGRERTADVAQMELGATHQSPAGRASTGGNGPSAERERGGRLRLTKCRFGSVQQVL